MGASPVCRPKAEHVREIGSARPWGSWAPQRGLCPYPRCNAGLGEVRVGEIPSGAPRDSLPMWGWHGVALEDAAAVVRKLYWFPRGLGVNRGNLAMDYGSGEFRVIAGLHAGHRDTGCDLHGAGDTDIQPLQGSVGQEQRGAKFWPCGV